MFEITHAEQAAWQRRAARELSAILHAHCDLPIIAWTVASAGSIVVAHVRGPAPPQQLRHTFETWRAALMLTEYSECSFADGSTYLRAEASGDRVRVRLIATVPASADEQVAP